MPRLRRHRTSSMGSYSEGVSMNNNTNNNNSGRMTTMETTSGKLSVQDWHVARDLLQSVLYVTGRSSTSSNSTSTISHSKWSHKSFLHQAAAAAPSTTTSNNNNNDHHDNNNDPRLLYMAKCLLDRCRAMDDYEVSSNTATATATTKSSSNSSSSNSTTTVFWQESFLTQRNDESGYTPLHEAIVAGNLAAILLYLQYPVTTNSTTKMAPMAVLHAGLFSESVQLSDAEGLTPLKLLNQMQTSNLKQGRMELQRLLSNLPCRNGKNRQWQQSRSRSFDLPQAQDDEFQELSHDLQYMNIQEQEDANERQRCRNSVQAEHGFEVVTFGRPHHCGLGVISSGGGSTTTLHHSNTTKEEGKVGNMDGTIPSAQTSAALAAATFRPQRVQEFAQERVLRDGSAIAVAAAAHHTLVACRNGHLYVFGLNKGGRLGLGDDCPPQCPLPRRVFTSLKRKHVTAIAAAENHSLCVTSDGMVWAWGSNQFGQLGDHHNSNNNNSSSSSNNNNNNNNNKNSRSIPKLVEELRQIPCVAVAAGERHSVALSRKGEVYVWGSNASGQLGVARRSGNQKVQRVEALWGSSNNNHGNGGGTYQAHSAQRKVTLAIAADDQSTLVLTAPTAAGLTQVNSVYWWGHGNHVPMRVPFDNSTASSSLSSSNFDLRGSMTTTRLINPTAIACGKYHNAAVTSDGRVYTWGTSSEALGHRRSSHTNNNNINSNKASSSSRATTSSPQLVTGMLPENGGGCAVAVSASEHHTAVVTDTGALFTWGAAHGKNVMGHKGVRWQPNPKRVPGIHRAVHVAVAKEHTVVLIETSFPKLLPEPPGLRSLEELSARSVVPYVDMFNVLPILIMAEHTQCQFLIDYCNKFVRQNLDGVLNVGNKSDLNQYLNHMMDKSNVYRLNDPFRDGHYHPFITDVITAGNKTKSSFYRDWTSSTEEWVHGCRELAKSPIPRRLLDMAAARQREEEFLRTSRGGGRGRRSSSCTSEDEALSSGRKRSSSYGSEQDGAKSREGNLDRIINKTATMDLSTAELAQEKSRWLGKEIRSVRKKLNQISKLRETEANSIVLTADEQAKMDRQPLLEAELQVYQTALNEVEKRIRELLLEEEEEHCHESAMPTESTKTEVEESEDKECAVTSPEKEAHATESSLIEEDKLSDASFFCEICAIKCPDKKSFELHQSGRKHRNRLAQVAEEEKEKAAQSIMAQKQMEQVKLSTTATPSSGKKTKKNPWGTSNTPQPKFKLPPPPHPVVPQVKHPETVAMKFSVGAPSPATPAESPTTDFSSILREQEAAASKTKPALKVKSPMAPKLLSPAWGTPAPVPNRQAPFHLHYAADTDLSKPPPAASNQRNSYSLADFLTTPKPAATPPAKKTPATFAWSATTPPTPKSSTVQQSSPLAIKSLSEIQAEEVDFKSREDRTYKSGDNSKWFIERRERANSMQAIQEAAEKERETQLMIEEQKQIEAQIQKELAEQRKKQQQQGGAQKGKSKPKDTPKKLKMKNNLPDQKNKNISSANEQASEKGTPKSKSKSKNKNNNRRGGGRKGGGPSNKSSDPPKATASIS